jgi:GT2 family glycosyltransferase
MISVVIPFFQDVDVLSLTLASLARQTIHPSRIDVVIVCDGAAEDVGAIPGLIDLPRTRILHLERRGHRVATARNVGIIAASEEVVLCLDFDCVCPPRTLAAHLAAVRRGTNPSGGCAAIGLRRFAGRSDVDRASILDGSIWQSLPPEVESASARGARHDPRTAFLPSLQGHPFPCNFFYACNVSFERNAALAVGLFSEEYNGAPQYEDIDLGYRLQAAGTSIDFIDAPVLHIENRAVSMQDRSHGFRRNLAVLEARCPDLAAFRNVSRSSALDGASDPGSPRTQRAPTSAMPSYDTTYFDTGTLG